MTGSRNDRHFEDRDEPLVDEQEEIVDSYEDDLLNDQAEFVTSYDDALLDERDHATLELRAEELAVQKRDVERGRVRIDKRIEQIPFVEDIDVEMDVVEVQRVPVSAEYDTPPENRYEGDTLIIPVVEEVLVVTRRYRVIEEVHVTTRREVRTERIEDELRREVLDVDVIDAGTERDVDRDL